MASTERIERLHRALIASGWIISEEVVGFVLEIMQKQIPSSEEFSNVYFALLVAIQTEPQQPPREDFLSANFLNLFPYFR